MSEEDIGGAIFLLFILGGIPLVGIIWALIEIILEHRNGGIPKNGFPYHGRGGGDQSNPGSLGSS